MLSSKQFVDAKTLLVEGVASLKPGEMVHLPHFNLMVRRPIRLFGNRKGDALTLLPSPAAASGRDECH
jgi:hypothetical protein